MPSFLWVKLEVISCVYNKKGGPQDFYLVFVNEGYRMRGEHRKGVRYKQVCFLDNSLEAQQETGNDCYFDRKVIIPVPGGTQKDCRSALAWARTWRGNGVWMTCAVIPVPSIYVVYLC